MSTDHDRQPDGPPTTLARSRWSRHRLAVGTAGVAAILGAGAYLVTDRIVNDADRTAAREVPVTVLPGGPAETPGTPSADPATASPEPTVSATETSAAPIPSAVAEEIKEARRKMAEDGVAVQRPIVPKVVKPAEDVKVTEKGSLKKGGILRVVTARGDLTDQRELRYVAGGVTEHRDIPCSQTFRFSTNPTPKKRDNLLMCWRTTAEKSVLAIVVDPGGHPSPDKAVDALQKAWRQMR
ncbi:hypothetical protein AMIS_64680 [Actinoplanes missouriensis 431]|uniref:Uncharacterized protein n=1 Tax=Actinoplanes missouriensis (strain ATCC 14538 / DSM 43046 / CBS 188.64 / JCM 3121 / NBRC 102363 / NCIMB 12654 / NRRL B-3342 / UNCC 431) TaxID=512565 RepID=I0HFA1_ACTM4|nr:hypothetical protein [Actinoplanes missouriensis]BAL91688.1 hypothetical protein AMIS_64680 [Actinoplanes missouriensis 431]